MPSTGNPFLDFILIILALLVVLVLGKAAIEAFDNEAYASLTQIIGGIA